MDKTSILKAFNTHFFEFLDDILSIYPENNDLKDAKTTFEFFKKANPTTIAKAWHQFVNPKYQATIDAGNIDYFLEKDYKEDLNHMANANEVMEIINRLRSPIQTMTPESKQNSLKYLQNLCKLANMYSVLATR
jgi:hypothetical protein